MSNSQGNKGGFARGGSSSYGRGSSPNRGRGGASHDRGRGGASHDRGRGGTSHDRGRGGTSHDRGKGGASHDRGKGGASHDRGRGGSSHDRGRGGASHSKGRGGSNRGWKDNSDGKINQQQDAEITFPFQSFFQPARPYFSEHENFRNEQFHVSTNLSLNDSHSFFQTNNSNNKSAHFQQNTSQVLHSNSQNNCFQRSMSSNSEQSSHGKRGHRSKHYTKKQVNPNQNKYWKNRRKSKQKVVTEQPSLFSFVRVDTSAPNVSSNESDGDTDSVSVISSRSFNSSSNEESDDDTSTVMSTNSGESSIFSRNDNLIDLEGYEIDDKTECSYVNKFHPKHPHGKESFISVFWDIENCPVPSEKSAIDIVKKIRDTFYDNRTEEEFIVACDTRNLNKSIDRELAEAHVTIIHANSENKNAADIKLQGFLQKFQFQHRTTNSAIVLISGDSDFSSLLHSLRYQHHIFINLVCNHQTRKALCLVAQRCMYFSDFVKDLPNRTRIDDLVYCLLISNLPSFAKTNAIKSAIKEIIQNISGKIKMSSNTEAEIVFINHSAMQKAVKKLKGQKIFGSEIVLKEITRYCSEEKKFLSEHKSFSDENLSENKIKKAHKKSKVDAGKSALSPFTKEKLVPSFTDYSSDASSSKDQSVKTEVSKKATMYVFVSNRPGDMQYWDREFKRIFSEKDLTIQWLESEFERYFLVTFKSLSKAQKAKKALLKHQTTYPDSARFIKIVKQIESIDLSLIKSHIEHDPKKIIEKKIEDHIQYIRDKEAKSLEKYKKNLKEFKDSCNKINSEEQLVFQDKCNEYNEQRVTFTSFTIKICQKLNNLLDVEVEEIDEKINELMRDYSRECTCLCTALPIYAKKNLILKKIQTHQVIILQAATGSGKSTQICQYLWREGYSESGLIVCTQPRKIAAISLAKYVSTQIGCVVGNVVGYRVGITKRMSDKTKILYVTDFTMLKMCMEDIIFTGISCIIIDEAHERSVCTDLLLGMVKKALILRPDLRVIVTSATIQSSIFQKYFNLPDSAAFQIPGRTFPIEDVWLKENVVLDNYYMNKGYLNMVVNKAYEIVQQQEKGDILAFLVTPSDTEKACDLLNEKLQKNNIKSDIRVLHLHGNLDTNEQQKIFEKTPNNVRKIVFSTNCAETSITIPGIKFVIDSGMVKEAQYDATRNLNVLSIGFTNKSSAEQRRGRAGRTQSGKCFRLYSKEDYELKMTDNMIPEILRVNLGQSLLKLIVLGIKNPLNFDFIESPSKDALSVALKQLIHLGAIDSSNNLLNFGKQMSALPLEPRLCHLILKGIDKGIGYDTIAVSSLATVSRNIFFRNSANSQEADVKKIRFCQSESDFLTFLEIYKEWSEVPKREKSRWCVLNCINARSLRLAHELMNELIFILSKELQYNVSTKFSKNENFVDIINELIFLSYSENICIFSGVNNFGYFSLDIPENLYIHPSSSLYSLGNWHPQYIVYDTILRTSQTFLINITSVQENTFETACNSGLIKININHLKNKRLSLYSFYPLGDYTLKAILGKKGAKLKQLEQKLKSSINGKCCSTDVNFPCGKLNVFIPQECIFDVEPVFSPRINEIKSQLLSWEQELDEISGITCLRVIIGAGVNVKEILLPGEFREVKINLENCDFASIKSNIETCGEIKYIRSGNKFHRVLFQKSNSARKAVKMYESNKSVKVKPLDIPTYNSTLPFFKVLIQMVRRQCNNTAFFNIKPPTCLPEAFRALLSKDILYSNKHLSFTLSKKNKDDIMISGLTNKLDVGELRLILEKHLPPGLKVGKLIPVFAPGFDTNDQDYDVMRKQILEMFMPFTIANKLRIDLKRPHKNDKYWQALVFFENPQDGQVAVNIIKSRNCFSSNTEQSILKLMPILETTLTCDINIFMAIKSQIEDAVKYFNEGFNSKDELKINATPKNDGITVLIQVTSNNIADIKDARNRLLNLIQGDQIFCSGKIELEKLFTDRGQVFLQNLVSQQANTYISMDHRRKVLSLFGSDASCTFIKCQLNSFLDDAEKDDFEEIHLKRSNSPRSILKEIISQYDIDLSKLCASCELTKAEINARKHVLTVFGTRDSINKCKQIVEELHEKFKGDITPDTPDVEECPVCQTTVDSSFHRLEYCGHIYCSVCLLLQISSCETFPLSCCKEGCALPIVLEDIRWAAGQGKLKEKELYSKAFAHFMMGTTEFKYCPSRDCPMIYRITHEDEFSDFLCPQCNSSICTRCCDFYHAGMSCNFYQNFKDDNDFSLKVWLKSDPENHKLCPSCLAPIEKNGGCMHMICWKCKCHMCWRCLKVFLTGDDVYKHQNICPVMLRAMYDP